MRSWWPVPPCDAFSWLGDSTYFWNTTSGPVVNGLQNVTRVGTTPLAANTTTFSRVLVMRNGTAAIGSPLDAVNFFDSVSGTGGASVDSNSVVLSGFSGSVALSVSGGAHLIVNGVDVGASANVAAGSTVRIRASSPATASSASYSLSIGGVATRTWNVVTRPAPAVNGIDGTVSGYSPVSANVGESGAASISIPITCSPGTGGMEPKLAITYSSQGGNGILGMGFGISGLSAVGRTGPVQYLDGIKGGVTFGANDRFTVDGQRLVLFSGTWGGDGAEYRTENESFSKITSNAVGNGLFVWQMKTKAGLTYDFGTSSDSRIMANRSSVPGDNVVMTWALEDITDALNDRLRFVYANPDSTDYGYPRIVSILYTENVPNNFVPGQEIAFIYEARPDVRTSYVAGAKIVMGKRLTAIECRSGGKVARRYEFAYQQAEISGNSQLISVIEKGKQPANSGDTWQTFPATTFTWDQKPAANTSLLTTVQDPSLGDMIFSRSPFSLMAQGDFNGDGRMDVIHFDDILADYYLAFANADGSFERHYTNGSFVASDAVNPNTSRIRTGDFNGDGRTDVLHISTGGSSDWVALSKGDGTFQVLRGTQLGALQNLTQTGDFKTELIAMDLDGDGRTDLVLLNANGNNRVFLSKGNGSFKEVLVPANDPFRSFRISSSNGTNTFLAPGDYNGDGLGDILLLYAEGQHTLALSNGDGTFSIRNNAQLGGISGVQFHRTQGVFETGDYNGDGITDLAYFDHDTTAWVALSKGDGVFETRSTPPMLQGLTYENSGHSRAFAADFNGDGLTDIFQAYYSASSSSWLVSSRGDGNFLRQLAGQLGALDGHSYEKDQQSRVFVGDFDGDGTDDVLHLHYQHQGNGTGDNFLALSNGFNADRIVQVTNGHGGYTKISYLPLTNTWMYTKGTDAVYPYSDVIGGMYVVATLVTRNGVDGDAFTPQANPVTGESTTAYHYFGARALLDGHGYQGFSVIHETNLETGITLRTEYVTSDPHLAGHPSRQVRTTTDKVVSDTRTTWTANPITLPNGNLTYFPYATGTVDYEYEVNYPTFSTPIKTTTVSGQTYDPFGNLTHSLTDYGGGFTEETTSTYTNDTTNWWLGRLSDTVVTQTSPGPVTATRHSTFLYSSTNGQLTRETIVTPKSNLRLQKDYVHDGFGNIKQSTLTDLSNPSSARTTTTTYTSDGRFIAQTRNALGQIESKTYDPLNGTVLVQTGPNGLSTYWDYDAFGRPLIETRPDLTQTVTQYKLCTPGVNGAPPRAVHYVRTQSAGSGPSIVYFDILDRQIRQDATGFDGRIVSTHRVFDAKGETVASSLPFFSSATAPTAPTAQYTTSLYDPIGRVYQQNVPGAATESGPRITTTAYAGLSATVTNPKQQTFQTVMDLRGRTASSTSFGTDTVTNTHDPYGNLIQVSDGRSHLTQMWYDGRGNKIKMTEPNSGTTIYSYNAFGELTSQTDALGRVTTLSYDAIGRMIRRVEPDAPGTYNGVQAAGFPVETDWVYEYAPNGQPNPNGIGKLGYVWRQSDGYLESYRYDGLGRLAETLTQVGAMQFVTATTFDEYSRPDTLSYPTGFAVRNHYNAYGHLDYVYDAATPTTHYWTATSVNARGQVVQEQLGNGLLTQRGYDLYTGLLGSIQTGGGSGTGFTASVQNLAYTFDKLNNLTQRQDSNRGITENFAYDSTNQLSGTTCSAAAAVTIACDHLGNITSRSDVGAYTYGERSAGPHAVTSIAGVNGQPARTLFYDAAGNCMQDGDTRLTYNAANQPVTIQNAAAGSVLFSYTPGRARLKRTTLDKSGALTNRVYVGSLYERDDGPSGVVHTHFIPAGGGVVAIHTRTQTTGGTTSQVRYVHKDHLGSIHTLTKEDGSIDEVLSFDAWGRRRTLAFDQTTQSLRYSYGTVASQTDRGFTGHEMLDAVGLIHMNGRIYDPTIGRFLSVDPVVQEAGNLQNLNRYCYVLNNPLSLTDPSGFSFFKHIGQFLKIAGKFIASQVAGFIVGVVTGVAAFVASGFNPYALYYGFKFGYGFGSAFTGTLLAGGSIGDAFRAGLEGGLVSLTTAFLQVQATSYFAEGTSETITGQAVQQTTEESGHGFFSETWNDLKTNAAYILSHPKTRLYRA